MTSCPRTGSPHGRQEPGCKLLGRHAQPARPVAAVTHGGVTIELLRNLLGDDALPPGLLATGIPPCAITTLDNLNPVMIASTSHLR